MLQIIILLLCIQISVHICGDPGLSKHVVISNISLFSGEKVVYNCQLGYKHSSGDLERTCQPDGRWNGTVPECVGKIM